MAKFNEKKEIEEVINYEGEKSFKKSLELELYSAVVTTFMSNKFYTSENDLITRINFLVDSLLQKKKKEFIYKLIFYARNNLYLRSIPIYLMAYLATKKQLSASLVYKVIQRVDEITELLAGYQQLNGSLKPLSMAAKHGIKKIFEKGKFDEYQYGKYKAKKKNITLKDAILLTHPHPQTKEQSVLFRKIIEGTLEIPYTWETAISKAGQTGKDKKEVWEELIISEKMGYMATLRNINNFLKNDVSLDKLTKVSNYLKDPKAIKYAKQLPFRFYSAYKNLYSDNPHNSLFVETLDTALAFSTENIQGFDKDTKVLIACDTSGSMEAPISKKSSITYMEIGAVLGAALAVRSDNVIVGAFGDTWQTIPINKKSVISNVSTILNTNVGIGTFAYKIMQYLLDKKIFIDKLFIFSDGQFWSLKSNEGIFYSSEDINQFNKWLITYKKTINPNIKTYIFDLAGYSYSPISIQHNNYLISGWSDKVFDMLNAIEQGEKVINEINKINI